MVGKVFRFLAYLSVLIFVLVTCHYLRAEILVQTKYDILAHDLGSSPVKSPSLDSGQAPLVLVQNAVKDGAVCLDGTPPGYYFRAGRGTGARAWIIFLEGGGWCYNEEECLQRSYTELGSSSLFPPVINTFAFFSLDPATNPDFANWNLAHFEYCDGASFAGDVDSPVVVKGRTLYFRGKRILSALLDDLFANRDLGSAESVLIGGCSAGGLATYLHCDSIASRMPAGARVKCLADSGVFIDVEDVSHRYSIREKYTNVFQMQNASFGVNTDCIADKPPTLQHQCFFAQYTLPYVQTPLMMLNSNYDTWSLHNILAPPEADPRGDKMRDCLADTRRCSPSQIALLQEFRRSTVEAVQPGLKPKNGAFLFSCFLHCTLYDEFWYKVLRVRNQTVAQAIGNWYFERTPGTTQSIDCAWPCNSCSAVTEPNFTPLSQRAYNDFTNRDDV